MTISAGGSADATLDASPAGEATTVAGPVAGRGVLTLYVVTVFLGATLLFLVEPMVAKMLLPTLGGAPAVWNTAMVFFQAALLGGYAFAHLTLGRLGPRRQPVVQLVALALPLLLLPIGVPEGWRPPAGDSPELWTLLVLTVMVGAPFLLLSTCGPTLQRWFSATSHPRADDPYFLYAAGNVGSLLALLAYPLLIEPTLALDVQAAAWSVLYVALVVLTGGCAVALWRHPRAGQLHALGAPATDGADAPVRADAPAPAATSARTRLRWVFLAAVPSALLLGVTRHISTDVASMPLLWVIPLSLYLVTFIVAFGPRPDRAVDVSARALKLLVIPLALSFFGLVASIWIVLGLHLTVFFCAAMVAHGRLSLERPEPARLTEFYLLLSVGGVVGGVLTALVAPLVFPTVVEYPIAIVLALSVLPLSAFVTTGRGEPATGEDEPVTDEREGGGAPGGGDEPGAAGTTAEEAEVEAGSERDPGEAGEAPGRRWPVRALALGGGVAVLAVASVAIRGTGTQSALTLSILVAAVAAVAAYAFARTPTGFAAAIGVLFLVGVVVPANRTVHQERTFFGVHRVYADATHPGRRVLLNGTTVHGMENDRGSTAGRPLTYYAESGPIGQWFTSRRDDPSRKVGLIGLGTGALAAYGRSGDRFTYYEIDPAVVRIAEDRSLFTFVPDSPAEVDFRVGDGRLELAAGDDRYDLLVVDAFSGDAIPLHLISDEAVRLYTEHLDEGGVIAFHISNRYFDFAPILGRLATERGLAGIIQTGVATPAELDEGKLDATWVLLARRPADLDPLRTDPRWQPLGDGAGAPLWTDSYSDLLHVFRWGG